jgi:hypothetical protein
MTVRSVPLSAMFGWLVDGGKLLGKQFGTLIGASALFLLAVVALMVPMWVVMFAGMGKTMAAGMAAGQPPFGQNMALFIGMYALTLVLSLTLLPPLRVGWFRLCRGVERGDSVGATTIFAAYADRALWLRSIGLALLAIALFAVVFALFALVFYSPFMDFMRQIQAQQAAVLAGVQPPPPHFPLGLMVGYPIFILAAMLVQFIYFIGFADLALRGSSPVEALLRAAQGIFKNIGKLAVFAFCASMLAAGVMVVIMLLLGLLTVLLAMLMKAMAFVVAMVIYLALLLCFYPLMFAINYFAWKSMLGDDDTVSV